MDSLFENQYKCTKKYFQEFYSYFYFKKPIIIVINLLLFFGFILGILSLTFSHIFFTENLVGGYIFLPIFVWIFKIIQYKRGVKTRYNQDLERNNGEPFETKIIVTDDGIDVGYLNSKEMTHIGYSKIKKIVKTKKYYILMTEAKLCCVFKKDGFIKGTIEDFLLFLSSKGIKG